jgi:hypothetical protein
MFNDGLERQACWASGQVGRVEEAKAQGEGRYKSRSITLLRELLMSMLAGDRPRWVLLVFLQQLLLL